MISVRRHLTKNRPGLPQKSSENLSTENWRGPKDPSSPRGGGPRTLASRRHSTLGQSPGRARVRARGVVGRTRGVLAWSMVSGGCCVQPTMTVAVDLPKS